jgi:hypothetical protein
VPSTFRSFTGLDVKEFDSFCSKVESRYDEKERRADGGHPFKLSLRNRLLMLLVYYRLYVTSRLVSFLFDLDHSNVLRDMRMIEPVVKEILPIPQKLHDRAKRASTPEEVEEYFPGFKAFIDATEQEIPRPKNRQKRKSHYSRKKKRHTVKTQLTVNGKGTIIHRTPHARGRRHDYDIFKDSHPKLPNRVRPETDLGYYGIQNDFPELETIIPFKKSRGQELTEEQKRFNKSLSKERVVVEHTIALLKKFKIMGQEFRNRLRHYDVMTDIVSGLVNLRIMGTTAL